jgi:hypothetical protein
VTPGELLLAYDEALARLAATTPEPGPAHRLIDPLLRLFGRDSRTLARRERRACIEQAARFSVAAGDSGRARALDDALRRRAREPARAAPLNE